MAQRNPMNAKNKRTVQVLKGSSLKSEPALGAGIASQHTTALVDVGDSSVILGYFQWMINKKWALLYLVPFFVLLCFLEGSLSTRSTAGNKFGMGLPAAITADSQGSVKFTV